ncbi:MAG: ribonuclease III [Thermomicrobiales bacterium]|nr:ribonuclease III [Thermomicrobiales bacterium]
MTADAERNDAAPTARRRRRRRTATAAPASLEDNRIAYLAEALGVEFHDPDLPRLALTHRSTIQDTVAAGALAAEAAVYTNERLEFVGDAVLGAVAAEYLYAQDRLADEGTLTRRRVALVRAETLVRWARELKLGDLLYLAHGERPTEGARDRMLAGAFEAVIGAIALDRGYVEARSVLRRLLERDAPEILARAERAANPKGRLQELLQERRQVGPTYRTVQLEGPDHALRFTVRVMLGDQLLGEGSGASKREAEQAAAAAALAAIEVEPERATGAP